MKVTPGWFKTCHLPQVVVRSRTESLQWVAQHLLPLAPSFIEVTEYKSLMFVGTFPHNTL